MEQIILNTNLRFVTAGLSAEQKGELFQALLEGNGEVLFGEVLNIYQYIITLQEEISNKKKRMRELGKQGALLRWKKKEAETADLFDDLKDVDSDAIAMLSKRKEPKENNINKNINIKKSFVFSEKQTEKRIENTLVDMPFGPPPVEEVREFVQEEGLCVEAETFVDFYESHGWKVGQTEIKNWKATVRLWHRRAVKEGRGRGGGVGLATKSGMENKGDGKNCCEVSCNGRRRGTRKEEDETYWHELMEQVRFAKLNSLPDEKARDEDGEVGAYEGDEFDRQDDGLELSPFARFMRRIEDNDILPEN